MPPSGDLAVVIPARNESDRIRATVTGAAALDGVDLVLVVDDGSTDSTGSLAESAGAKVVRHGRSRGKAAAMETGAEAVRLLEQSDGRPIRGTCCSWTETWVPPRVTRARSPGRCAPGTPT